MGSKRDRNKGAKRRGRQRTTSSLAQHRVVGHKVKPPFVVLTEDLPVKTVIWQRDDLPNHLWALSHLAVDPDAGFKLLNVARERISAVLAGLGCDVPVTGTLVGFEGLPEHVRAPLIDALRASGDYERFFPIEWAQSISLYDDAPGRWTADGHLLNGVLPDQVVARNWLGPAIEAGQHGQSLAATRSKMVVVAGMFAAGMLHNLPSDLLDVGIRYPYIEEEERSWFEPSMRATYGALADLDDDAERRATRWAETFWRKNWPLFACEPLEPLTEPADGENRDVGTGDMEIAERRQRVVDYFRGRVDEIDTRFKTASRGDPDLYNPDRYEVLTGLTGRIIRQMNAAVHTPMLWSAEFATWLLRASVETKIVLAWLEHEGGDIYAGYKDYGRGRLKLLKLHLEEYVDEHGDELDQEVHDYLEVLTAEVNQDIWEEFQEISVEKTFSGVNARKMAIEADLKQDYDFAFAPASGAAHGDWVALDREALTRCLNPLHRWHRIPRPTSGYMLTPNVIAQALDYADDIVELYQRALATSGGLETVPASGE